MKACYPIVLPGWSLLKSPWFLRCCWTWCDTLELLNSGFIRMAQTWPSLASLISTYSCGQPAAPASNETFLLMPGFFGQCTGGEGGEGCGGEEHVDHTALVLP